MRRYTASTPPVCAHCNTGAATAPGNTVLSYGYSHFIVESTGPPFLSAAAADAPKLPGHWSSVTSASTGGGDVPASDGAPMRLPSVASSGPGESGPENGPESSTPVAPSALAPELPPTSSNPALPLLPQFSEAKTAATANPPASPRRVHSHRRITKAGS